MSISNEELLIRALVDDIYQTEEKINSLNESLNKDNSQNTSFKRIENLKQMKNNLIQQRISLNDSFALESKNNSDVIQEKLSKIKEIENKLQSKKNELIEYNIISFQSLTLKKYILSNKSDDFLTEEQISDVIFDGQSFSVNSEIQKLKREIEINKASECVIINNYNEINSKIAQVEENLKMLKEEKNIVKSQLINLISCKETLEQIIKININGLDIHNKMNKKEKNEKNIEENGKENNYKWTKPIDLYIYELYVIDPKKAANNLCNDLFDLFNLNNDGKKKDIRNSDIDILGGKNETNDSNDINIFSQYASDNYLYKDSDNLFTNDLFSTNTNLFTLDKNSLISTIQSEVEKFSTGRVYSYKTVSEFLENLSILIISKFQYVDIIMSADSLTIYLSYFFKSLYYESIINSNIKFINKDYKMMKKEYNKLIPYLQSESSKLDTKYNEYQSKTKIIEKQIKLMQKENLSIKKQEPINLSLEEQNYIQICSKANSLIKQKNSIQETIGEFEKKNNILKNKNDLKIKKINKEINKIDEQIKNINEDIKNKKNITNENIDYYQKLIQEKYNVIKKQLQIYKNKYGTNLDIYNRLINSINDTIKKTYDKPPLIIINNNNNINNSHIFNNEIGKIIQNYNSKSKSNLKENILPNNASDFTDNLKFDSNSSISNKKLYNFEFDMTSIDKSPFEFDNNKFKEISNFSINNASNSSQMGKDRFLSIREKNIKKINVRRKLNKALSNISFMLDSKSLNPSYNSCLKRNNIKKNNSLSYDLRDYKNSKFLYSSINNNMSSKRRNNNNKNNYISDCSIFSLNNSSEKNNINYIRVKKMDKYNKSFTRQLSSKSKSKSNSLGNYTQIMNFSNSLKNNKFQSFSFINKNKLDCQNSKNRSHQKSNIIYNMLNKENSKNKSNSQKRKTNSLKMKINDYKNILNNIRINSEVLDEKNSFKISLVKPNFNLKEKIIRKEKFSQKILSEKIKPLTKMTFCYYRVYHTKLNRYNPLFNIPSEILCKSPYHFSNATISLTKSYDKLKIAPIDHLKKIEFSISDVENTIVNSKTKLIIEVHRNFRKFKEINNDKSMNDFIKSQTEKYPHLTGEEIEKCAKNKNYNFSLMVTGGKIIELIICSYQEFKIWINGLAFLIKNKNEIIKFIKENNNNKI